MTDVPKYNEMMNPVLSALKKLGGSATNSEIENVFTESQVLVRRNEIMHEQQPLNIRR